MMNRPLIIAEAGVNHNGSEDLALQLVDLAVRSNVDVVKFQIFKAATLVTSAARKAEYQTRNTGDTGDQKQMLKALELPPEAHKRIAEYARQAGVVYLSTAFDVQSLRFLVDQVDVPYFKISSGDLTNAPLLLEHAKYKRPIYLSTGMATLGEIEEALGVLAFGLIEASDKPCQAAFRDAYFSEQGQSALKEKVTLLHCTTEYPTPANEVNMAAMQTLRQAFQLEVGFSDHSVGNVASIMAVATGATVVEKHFTLDKSLPGPDHLASMSPEELMDFMTAMDQASQSLGSAVKRPTPNEFKNIEAARRSLVASRAINKGELFNQSNVIAMRPGLGLSPIAFWDIEGTESDQDYQPGQMIGV